MPTLTLVLSSFGVVGLAVASRDRRTGRRVAAVALALQLVHTGEHLVQLAVWVRRPHSGAELTPWAAAARDALAEAPGVGTELLHLLGNLVFLIGLAALVESSHGERRRAARRAARWQGAHAVEHVLLTASVVLLGRPLGATNGFGLLAAGPLAASARVWLHACVNVVVTVLAMSATGRFRRGRVAPQPTSAASSASVSVSTTSTPVASSSSRG